MSKKQDFLRNEQSRDKHPERMMKGSAAEQSVQQVHKSTQQPHTGKVANDHNQHGQAEPTQTHQSYRTPESRHDRQTRAGGPQNVIQARTGGKGAGRGPRGAG